MQNSTGGSFIPKRSTGKVSPSRSSRRIYVFSYIAYTLFFGTLLSVAGIFLLSQQAQSQLASYATQLAERQSEFSDSDLDQVINLNARLTTAKKLVDTHLAPSYIFEQLEESVLQSVQLSELLYENSDDGGVTLAFSGNAETFDALVFQRDVMETSNLLDAANVVEVSYGSDSVEAVGNSSRNQTTPFVTEAQLTFTFEDATLYDKIGYKVRPDRRTPTASTPSSAPSTATPANSSPSATTETSPPTIDSSDVNERFQRVTGS